MTYMIQLRESINRPSYFCGRDEAESLDKVKEYFIGNISHLVTRMNKEKSELLDSRASDYSIRAISEIESKISDLRKRIKSIKSCGSFNELQNLYTDNDNIHLSAIDVDLSEPYIPLNS